MAGESLPDTVAMAAEEFGDRIALVGADGAEVRYDELHRRSCAVAAGLYASGVRAGDVVALRLASDIPYVLAYLGAAAIGAITAGINPKLAAGEQDALVALCAPRMVIDDDATVHTLEADGRNAPTPPVIDHDEGRDVVIVFTSGTTGLPKGAVFTNRQLGAIVDIDVGGRWGGGGHMLASTQFAHVGFMTKLPWYLRTGSTIHMIDRWTASGVLRLVSEHRMSSIGGVAPQIALMLRAPESHTLDFSDVSSLVVGGGTSSPALVDRARERFGASYSIRYSSTECGGCGTGTAFDADDEEALHTVGRPRPGVEVSIRAEDGSVVPDGDVGEVCLRSAAMMDRYWNDPETTAATIRDGWLWSGDLGRLDDRGLLRLAGRRKEMYIRGGYNVYPMEVEAVLADHPDVVDVAVVGVPDEVMGERGVAVVVPVDPASPPTLERLCDHLRGRVAPFKLPEAIHIVEALPLTPMQKVDRRALEASLAP